MYLLFFGYFCILLFSKFTITKAEIIHLFPTWKKLLLLQVSYFFLFLTLSLDGATWEPTNVWDCCFSCLWWMWGCSCVCVCIFFSFSFLKHVHIFVFLCLPERFVSGLCCLFLSLSCTLSCGDFLCCFVVVCLLPPKAPPNTYRSACWDTGGHMSTNTHI